MKSFGTVMPSQAKQDEGKDIWVARFFFEKQYVARKFNSYEEAEAYRQKVEAARRANDFDFLYAEIEAKKREIKARKAENERKDEDEGTIQKRNKYDWEAQNVSPEHIKKTRKRLEHFTHKLLLPMTVRREKLDELIRRIHEADPEQILCCNRPITIPPQRIIFLGFRTPRFGSTYVYSIARNLLGDHVQLKMKPIDEHTPRNVPKPREIVKSAQEEEYKSIRALHEQGFSLKEIIQQLHPEFTEYQIERVRKTLTEQYKDRILFFTHPSEERRAIIRSKDLVKKWLDAGKKQDWIGKHFNLTAGQVCFHLGRIRKSIPNLL
jgi:hypothetical protein